MNKLDSRCAVVRFCYHSYDYRPNWTPLSPITITNNNNRVDARFVDRENKEVILIEMSCPWMDNRKQKEEEKNLKYAPLELKRELKRQHPGFKIQQFNIVIDALGGYSRILKEEIKTLVGSDRCREVLRRM